MLCYCSFRSAEMRLTEDELDREMRYQTIMHFMKRAYLDGLISEEEYHQSENRYIAKFSPCSGSLLSGKFLICVKIGANICNDKEGQDNEDCTEN